MTLTDNEKAALVRQARELCRSQGAELLYLTLFGSALYGTDAPGKSDLDIRGIFLPSLESLLLEKAPGGLHYSSGGGGRKNSAGDVDIDLWSAQRWLLELLPAGDMGALDLLFSPSRADCALYKNPALGPAFAQPLRLVDTGNGAPYAAYSLRQGKKYGIKGSRLGALRAVRDRLRAQRPSPQAHERLGDYLDVILAACADGRFCSVERAGGEETLHLCGKLHPLTIRMPEFIKRVEDDLRRYGARAEEPGVDEIDFKALSHALRAQDQLEELLLTGKIVFPLKKREELRAVKAGKYSWEELEERILRRIAEVEALRKKAPCVGVYDAAFAKACLLACYKK